MDEYIEYIGLTEQQEEDFKKVWKKCSSKYDIKSQPSVLPPVDRIIAIGDIHGDWSILLKQLKLAKVINDVKWDGLRFSKLDERWEELKWIGKETVVVQVGDQIDSCRDNCDDNKKNDKSQDLMILKFMTKLHNLALKEGGAVYSLLGNHEIMNTSGNMRYVSEANIKQFKVDYKVMTDIDNNTIDREMAFRPGNEIAEFMACTRQYALIIGNYIFAHAGILPEIAKKYKIDDMNKAVSLYLYDRLAKNDKAYNDLIENKNSPIWTRIFGRIRENATKQDIKNRCNKYLDPLKEIYNAGNMVVGHTPDIAKGMLKLCGDRLSLTDYGASNAFDEFKKKKKQKQKQRVQVLEILDNKKVNILE